MTSVKRLILAITATLIAVPATAQIQTEEVLFAWEQPASLYVDCPHCQGAGQIMQLDAGQQPTPMAGIGAALQLLNPKGKTFVDLGCGYDCRAGIVAVRDFGATEVLAVEIDPVIAASARRYVAANGLSHKIKVVTADAADVEIPAGAVGFAYLWPQTLEELQPQIARFDRFASYSHPVPGLTMRHTTSRHGDVYLYSRPRPKPQIATTVVWPPAQQRPTAAVWRGRQYTSPVCTSRNCTMCNAIRRQLGY